MNALERTSRALDQGGWHTHHGPPVSSLIKLHRGGQSALRKLDPRRTLIIGRSDGELIWSSRLYFDSAKYEPLDSACSKIVDWFQSILDDRTHPRVTLPSSDNGKAVPPQLCSWHVPPQFVHEAAIRHYLEILGDDGDQEPLPSQESCLEVLQFGWDVAGTFECKGILTVGEYGAGLDIPAPAGKWWAAMRYDEHIIFPTGTGWKYGFAGILVVARDHGSSTLGVERLQSILAEANYVEGSESYLTVDGASMWIVDSEYGTILQNSGPVFDKVAGNGEPILDGRGARISYEGDGRRKLFALLKEGIIDALVIL